MGAGGTSQNIQSWPKLLRSKNEQNKIGRRRGYIAQVQCCADLKSNFQFSPSSLGSSPTFMQCSSLVTNQKPAHWLISNLSAVQFTCDKPNLLLLEGAGVTLPGLLHPSTLLKCKVYRGPIA